MRLFSLIQIKFADRNKEWSYTFLLSTCMFISTACFARDKFCFNHVMYSLICRPLLQKRSYGE
jgi:hypothetical protein